MQINAKRFDTCQPIQITIEGTTVTSVTPIDDQPNLPWIAPGLIDLQVNGCGGQEFSSPKLTVEGVAKIAKTMDAAGVVRTCPTITTNSTETIDHAMRTIAQACAEDSSIDHRLPGIHLEGPFISTKDGARGAHPLEYVCPPDYDKFARWQEIAKGRIRIVTISPEYDEAVEFTRRVNQSGVIVSIGHTAATPDQVKAVIAAGATMSTHLGNGAFAQIHRHHNFIWPQLADDRLTAGIITDGHHLPSEVVRTFIRAKSPERCVITSDISGLTGLPPGRYETELCDLEILPSGKLVVAGQSEMLAGASRTLDWCLGAAIQLGDVSPAVALQMAVENPAKLIGVTPGRLEPTGLADLILFDWDQTVDAIQANPITIRQTILRGETVYTRD